MTGPSRATTHPGAPPTAWGRGDAVLLALTPVTLVLIAVQFALAGFGAFTMDKTPADNAYGAHAILGLVIAALTLIILVTVLASSPARTHRRTLWLAITLVVLTVILQPVLGTAGTKAPALGALHGLNAAVIFALTGLLAAGTARRKKAATP